MKKIYNILIYLLIMVCLLIPLNSNANELEKLEKKVINNVFYTRRGGGKPYVSLPYEIFNMSNKVVFCIEPGVEVSTNFYKGYNGFGSSPFDDNINNKLELIGYYGYDYPNHQTLRYRMATQALIWELISGQIVEFWTKQYGMGYHINISYERDEILNLIKNHNKIPSFVNKNYDISVGQELVLIDKNQVLSNFEIKNSDTFKYKINGNILSFHPLKLGEYSMWFQTRMYDNNETIIYIGKDKKTQKMGFFRLSYKQEYKFNVNVTGGKIIIHKLDIDTGLNKPQGDASLKGAIYGIYDNNNKLISTIKTDNSGYGQSENVLSIGRYYLKEIESSRGYLIDDKKYYFNYETNNTPIIKVYETIIKSDVLISKYLVEGENSKLVKESGIKFSIYNANGKYVDTIVTDKNGIAKIKLVYGTYIFKQLNTTNGYYKVDDFKVIVDENSPNNINLVLKNLPIKKKVKIIKVDNDSKKPILSLETTFKIKDLSTNHYICDKVNNSKICEFKTNSEGFFMTNRELVAGTYQLEEVVSPSGYLLNQNPYIFHIDNNAVDNQYIEIILSNKKKKGSIFVTKKGEELIINNNDFYYEQVNLQGVEFSLYAMEDIVTLDGIIHYKKNELIKKLVTNKDGVIIFDDLFLGKYILKETKFLNDYDVIDKEYNISLSDSNNNQNINIINNIKKGNLELIKVDSVTNEVIPNTVIGVYNQDDKCLFLGKTDKFGKILINNLYIDDYYLLEKESAKGYYLMDKKINFKITSEKTEKIVLANEKIIIDVPSTSIKKYYLRELMSFSFIIIGVVIYVKTKKSKQMFE